MTSRAQELLREALTLPIGERADVAANCWQVWKVPQQIVLLQSKLPGRMKSSDGAAG